MQDSSLKNTQPGPEKDGLDKVDQNKWLSQSLSMFARFSSWVIGPVFIGIIVGKWLEKKYGDGGQIFFLACVGLSFLISMAGLILEASKEYRKIVGNDKPVDTTKK